MAPRSRWRSTRMLSMRLVAGLSAGCREAPAVNVLIRAGSLHVGNGADGQILDIAISSDRVTAIGKDVIDLENRAPGEAQLSWMKAHVVKGMREGALGFSAGAFYPPRSTYAEPTLPTAGVRYVLVNGKVAHESGAATGSLAGSVLRRVPTAGAC